jgi:hypothetical protein
MMNMFHLQNNWHQPVSAGIKERKTSNLLCLYQSGDLHHDPITKNISGKLFFNTALGKMAK